jgi:hypothetical protein
MASNQEEQAKREAAELKRLKDTRDSASSKPASQANNQAFRDADKAWRAKGGR